MSEQDPKAFDEQEQNAENSEQYSLNDDRRVKVLSPGAMVAKRFFRNRIAMVGLIILIFMFTFSFLGGLISPYKEDQAFYKIEVLQKEYASAKESDEFFYLAAEGQTFAPMVQALSIDAYDRKKAEFDVSGETYSIETQGNDMYAVLDASGTVIGYAYKDIFKLSKAEDRLTYDLQIAGLLAHAKGQESFTVGDKTYDIASDGVVTLAGEEIGYIGRYVVQALMPDQFITRDFKDQLIAAINADKEEFVFTDAEGNTFDYTLEYKPWSDTWEIKQEQESRVYDLYAQPSWEHWLGTDRYGMDMLTRLMYGGRVSLLIGFIVEIIATVIAIILGGISGYFGGWVDNLIMRIVDIFYCIPSLPIIIILGAAMDTLGVDPKIRMIYLMLILGFLGWPGVARMIRGQILSLREQEFMTATEATGLSVSRRIFRHLIPNVIPQLIVSCTAGLGSTIIMEATLSFLGLGVRHPFASWGNIINDVNSTFVLTNYWFIWIPAGALLLLTVLAFNLVGDGLRDAFDPKMKR